MDYLQLMKMVTKCISLKEICSILVVHQRHIGNLQIINGIISVQLLDKKVQQKTLTGIFSLGEQVGIIMVRFVISLGRIVLATPTIMLD